MEFLVPIILLVGGVFSLFICAEIFATIAGVAFLLLLLGIL